MMVFARTLRQLSRAEGELRAGGTDLMDRRLRGVSSGPVVDLRDLPDRDRVVALPDGGLSVGSGLTIQQLADHPDVLAAHPGLAQAAAELATPQIRARATVGGNLTQRVRCWYYRNPSFSCAKTGGGACLARTGNHSRHASHDAGGPCIAPHPSTLAVALIAYGGSVTVRGKDGVELVLTVQELLGDGRDPTRDHTLSPGSYLASIELPPPNPLEGGAYVRAAGRARAEWPLVEAVARVRLAMDGTIEDAQVVLGAVTNRPLLVGEVPSLLIGQQRTPALFQEAGKRAVPELPELPESGWKADLIAPVVHDVLTAAWEGATEALRMAPPPPPAPLFDDDGNPLPPPGEPAEGGDLQEPQ